MSRLYTDTVPPVGISDLTVYVPDPCIESSEVVIQRSLDNEEKRLKLERAASYTAQQRVRFPEVWQDSATLAGQACYALLQDIAEERRRALRFLGTGTETTADHSKPVSAYVQGMMERAGYPLPETMSTFQTQHACAGGSLAIFSIASQLALSGRADESGIVLCTDIARYKPGSTAEITQGAGGVALLVEPNPRLISLDLGTAGYASRDVDDFFRPLGSETARVKGRYSLRCYREALEGAFLDYCRRSSLEPRDALVGTDLFVLHVPYYSLPLEAMQWLLKKYLGLKKPEAEAFLDERGFQASIEPARVVGNLYSGSMFMALQFLLHQQAQQRGSGIEGRRILFASYGSGNTMLVFSGTVVPGAVDVIQTWQPEAMLANARSVPFSNYDNWVHRNCYDPSCNDALKAAAGTIPPGMLYLQSLREDGYREYSFSG